MIVGIDEVGRGPWAGPLVVGAVLLGSAKIEGLTDSKKLSKQRREVLAKQIIEQADSYGLGWVDAAEIDEIGLSAALVVATKRAVERITAPYHEIIIDGTVNFLEGTTKGQYVTTLKKADLLISAVSAASIIAKVARDDYMAQQDAVYEGYEFTRHVGYGTALHRAAIAEYGITPLHRRSFAPIAALVGTTKQVQQPAGSTAKSIGNAAETVASTWLSDSGYTIIQRNWKTRFCEIDIIAEKGSTLFFIEVKHRETSSQGGGMAAITPMKLRQMHFAASLYLTKIKRPQDARLAALSTSGVDDRISIDELLLID